MDSAQLAQMGVQILVSHGVHLRTHLKDHTGYESEIHGKPRRMSFLVGEAQLTGCLKVWVSDPLEWNAGIYSDYVQDAIQILSMRRM